MKRLYESIMDIDDNIENITDSLLVGGHYKIDVHGIRYNHLKNVFKVGLLKIRPKYDVIDSQKITIDNDQKVNKMIESLCKFILNLPIEFTNKRTYEVDTSYWAPLWDCQKTMGRCSFQKTIGGQLFFYADAKHITVNNEWGIKTYTTPNISIPLIKI